jgi:hypothetical protein
MSVHELNAAMKQNIEKKDTLTAMQNSKYYGGLSLNYIYSKL